MGQKQKILLIDLHDSRRESRVMLLDSAGYDVETRNNCIIAERLDHEGRFDIVVIAMTDRPSQAADYSDQLSRVKPKLPILLITDAGVFVPRGTMSEYIEAGHPFELLKKLTTMLANSSHVREL